MRVNERRKKLRFWVRLFLSSREFHGVMQEWKLYHDCIRTYLRMWGHIWGAREVISEINWPGSASRSPSDIKSFYCLYIKHMEFWVSNTPVASYSGLICQICLFASEKSSLVSKIKCCKFDPWNDKVSVNDYSKMIFNVQILLIFLFWCYPQDQ